MNNLPGLSEREYRYIGKRRNVSGKQQNNRIVEIPFPPMTKKIIVSLLILFLVITGIIVYGLQLMEVEDRYGDLQNLYWNSKDGDIILNKVNSKIGIVELDKSRIYVKENDRLIDLEEWLDPNDKKNFQAAIYRLKNSPGKQTRVRDIYIKTQCKFITEVNVHY